MKGLLFDMAGWEERERKKNVDFLLLPIDSILQVHIFPKCQIVAVIYFLIFDDFVLSLCTDKSVFVTSGECGV